VRTLSVVALQTAPVFRDPAATLAQLGTRLDQLRGVAPHVELVVLPELHLSSCGPPLEESDGYDRSVAVEIPGPITDALGELARRTGVWLVPGSVYELGEDGRIHNTCVVLSPEGELVAQYRKVFPWQPHEDCAPGGEFVTFDVPGAGRLGLAICYDASFPETCRQLAWMGAEVVLHMSLTTTSDRPQELVLARANAIFNQLYFVSVNAAAPAGLGRSLIVDPEGIVRLQAGDAEEILTDVLDLDAVTRVRQFGTGGVSRLWEQAQRMAPGLDLSMYRPAAGEPAAPGFPVAP